MSNEVSLRKVLQPLAEVRAGEALTALVLTGTIFLLLTAYYLLKAIREPPILLGGGAEVKAYAAAGRALLLIPILRAHGAVARLQARRGRNALDPPRRHGGSLETSV